jgi:hypothetical protein
MTGLPKNIIKKYGVSKKAWAVFRGTKRKSRSKTKKVYSMAKRRRKSVSRKSGLTGIMGGIVGTAIGVGGYILFETMVEPYLLKMANISNPLIVNLAELGIGLFLARKSGVVGQVGKAAIIINIYQILYPMLSNIGNKSVSSTDAYNY